LLPHTSSSAHGKGRAAPGRPTRTTTRARSSPTRQAHSSPGARQPNLNKQTITRAATAQQQQQRWQQQHNNNDNNYDNNNHDNNNNNHDNNNNNHDKNNNTSHNNKNATLPPGLPKQKRKYGTLFCGAHTNIAERPESCWGGRFRAAEPLSRCKSTASVRTRRRSGSAPPMEWQTVMSKR
jgi:hypothetical protein